jgi:hypothetical protein
MSVEKRWSFDRIATSGEAEGRTCIFCQKPIAKESQPGHWVLKAVEDNQDSDFAVEDGYAHHQCSEDRQAQSRKSRFALPEVPKGPQGR